MSATPRVLRRSNSPIFRDSPGLCAVRRYGFHDDNHRLHSFSGLLKIIPMNLSRTIRAQHESVAWRVAPGDARHEMPYLGYGLADLRGAMCGHFPPLNRCCFASAPLDTLRRTDSGVSHRKHSVSMVTTRHCYEGGRSVNSDKRGFAQSLPSPVFLRRHFDPLRLANRLFQS